MVKFFVLFSFFATSVFGDVAWPTLVLKNGTTYHDVKVLAVHPLVLNIRAQEGLFQVKKSDLPEELAQIYPVDKTAVAVDAKKQEEALRKNQKLEKDRMIKVATAARERAEENERRSFKHGVRILSFTSKSSGFAIVELRNETDLPVEIPPRSILCRSSDDRVFDGVWVTRSSQGPVRNENNAHLPGNSTYKLAMRFFRNPDISISEVYWNLDPVDAPAPSPAAYQTPPTVAPIPAGSVLPAAGALSSGTGK